MSNDPDKSDDTPEQEPTAEGSKSLVSSAAPQSTAIVLDNSEELKLSSVSVEPPRKKRNFAGTLFNLLLLTGLAALGFMFFKQDRVLNQLLSQQNLSSQERTSSASNLSTLQTNTQSLNSQLNQTITKIEAQDSQLSKSNLLITQQGVELTRLNRELISARLKINDNITPVNQAWQLAEAESLLKLAQQRLTVTGDINAAIALFIASDDILQEINDPAISLIRETLALDLEGLHNAAGVDIQVIYIELGELNQRVANLQVVSAVEEQLAAGEEVPIRSRKIEEKSSGMIGAILDKLNEYITVRKRDDVIKPLLSSEQQVFLRQNIQLQVQQARLALLRGQETVFLDSLKEAKSSIELLLVGNSPEKQSVLNELAKYSDMNILVIAPKASNALKQLQELLATTLEVKNEP